MKPRTVCPSPPSRSLLPSRAPSPSLLRSLLLGFVLALSPAALGLGECRAHAQTAPCAAPPCATSQAGTPAAEPVSPAGTASGTVSGPPAAPLPQKLNTIPPPDPSRAVNLESPRVFKLEGPSEEDHEHNPQGVDFAATINGIKGDPELARVDQRVRSGTSEVWAITNDADDMMHPFHVHGRQFRVLERIPAPGHPAIRVPVEEGYKDTVQIFPHETVKILVDFDIPPGNYFFHCHVLEHVAQHAYEFDVRGLAPSAEEVGFAGVAVLECLKDARDVVSDVDPVAPLEAVTVDGKCLAFESVQNHQREKLFGELIGAVVVRAVRRDGIEAVRMMKRPHEMVGGCFAR